MYILWQNKFDSYTITANSEESGYPATNIQDVALTKATRSTGDTSEWWKIDAGAGNTITATGAAIAGHNITSGATIKIQGNATDAWGGPTVDETITHKTAVMTEFFSTQSLRFWRFLVEDASNPDTYIKIGRLFLGTYISQSNVIAKDFPEQHIDTSFVDHTVTGEVYGDQGIVYKLYNYQFPYLTNTQKGQIQTMFETVGLIKPVFFIPDESDLAKVPPLYGTINDNLIFNHIVGYVWNCSISVREGK